MKLAPLFVVAIFSVQLAEAAVWKVGLPEDPAGTPLSHTLRIDRGKIALIGAEDRQVLQTVSASDVIAMWYDDRAIKSYGREWMDQMVQLCYELCTSGDLMGPLILMAAGGTGYLASKPFEVHEHFVTVQFRQDARSQFLIFRTTWAEHFWLMTDLSSALGRKWLNMPERRAALYWGLADRTRLFDRGSFIGATELRDSEYDVMFWKDNKAHGGVVLLFGRPGQGTPPLVAAVPVTVEEAAFRDYPAEYCTDRNGTTQVWRFGIGGRLFTLRSAAEACGKAIRW